VEYVSRRRVADYGDEIEGGLCLRSIEVLRARSFQTTSIAIAIAIAIARAEEREAYVRLVREEIAAYASEKT
jgi:hypothetical protein